MPDTHAKLIIREAKASDARAIAALSAKVYGKADAFSGAQSMAPIFMDECATPGWRAARSGCEGQIICPRRKPRAGRGVHFRGRSERRIGATE